MCQTSGHRVVSIKRDLVVLSRGLLVLVQPKTIFEALSN